MNKRLRAKAKIQRDKERKSQKRLCEQPKYEDVFTIKNFVSVLPKCRVNVSWKSSVQKYFIKPIRRFYNDYKTLNEYKLPRPISDKVITIWERGKARTITPIHVKDRVIQKVLCDYALVPILTKTLIYDNGASMKGKGISFSRNRMAHHLMSAVKEYGIDFYVLTYDFKSYFDSIPHRTCRMILEKHILDKHIVDISMEVVKSPYRAQIEKMKNESERKEMLLKLENDELCGICLGSQVSQILALVVASDIDHYIKDTMRFKHYIRYMDDGVVIAKTKEELQVLYLGMIEIANKIGLQFNDRKTRIAPIRRGFQFLKIKYFISDTGKIIRKLTRNGILRERRKLKKLAAKVRRSELTIDCAYESMQSWVAHSKFADGYITRRNMMKLYNQLFDGYRISRRWKRRNRRELLQADKWSAYRWCCDG